jgi:hypothetical protein
LLSEDTLEAGQNGIAHFDPEALPERQHGLGAVLEPHGERDLGVARGARQDFGHAAELTFGDPRLTKADVHEARVGAHHVREELPFVEEERGLARAVVGVVGGVFVATREAHLAGHEHGLARCDDVRVGVDRARAELHVDAPREIFELEKGYFSASVSQDLLAISFDHADHFHEGPVLHAGELGERNALELGERRPSAQVALERMTRDVEAERLALAHQGFATIPRVAHGVVASGRLGALRCARVEEAEHVGLAALAVSGSGTAALECGLDAGKSARAVHALSREHGVERAALDEGLEHALVDALGVHARAEVEEIGERSARGSSFQ